MAFKLEDTFQAPTVVIQSGKLRAPKDEELVNEVGLALELDTEDGGLEGTIRFHSVKTGLKNKKQLAEAIEKFMNDILQVQM